MIEKRSAGVLMPIFSLPGEYSSGAFGRDAYAFVDFLAEGGFSYWQVLPFTATDAYHSPYASPSSFSMNPAFIDLEALFNEGVLTAEELSAARETEAHVCNYARLSQERFALLSSAAARFAQDSFLEEFLSAHPYIKEYCVFMALKAANGETRWQDFSRYEYAPEVYHTYAFIAYTFLKQWNSLHAYALERGISVIGDLPIYVSLDSADVYFHRTWFDLDERGFPRGVAGVPPDYFSENGQLWGNPLYRWDRMKEDGYLFWRERIRHMLALFDGVRLDHFRGFDTYYDIPYGASDARHGVWREGPRHAIVDVLREEGKGSLLIAEDLGELFPSVTELLDASGFPGMRVFAFALDGEGSPHIPYRYPHNTVAYSGTHDNNTLLGFLMSLPEERRREYYRYSRYEGTDPHAGCRAVIETLYASHAGLLILPIQDLLLYGADARFNTPGRAEGNWEFRVSREALGTLDLGYFRTLAARYGRL